MRILLDECVPRPLRQDLPQHDVPTIREQGWDGKQNGELLALMSAAGFEVLLTADQNLRFQQNLEKHGIAVIIMIAFSNRLEDLIPLIPQVESTLLKIQPGEAIEIRAAAE
jgi:hypothetical protein